MILMAMSEALALSSTSFPFIPMRACPTQTDTAHTMRRDSSNYVFLLARFLGPSVVTEVRTLLYNFISEALQFAASAAAQNPNDFLTDFKPEEDIFVLGNISMSDHPPDDLPDIHYGLSASHLCERIHSRCCGPRANFRPRTLTEWTDRFLKAQDEILALEPEMVYRSAGALVAREQLDNQLGRLRHDVSQAYVSAFQNIQDTFVTLLGPDPRASAPGAARGLLAVAMEKVEADIQNAQPHLVVEMRLHQLELERERLIQLLNENIERSVQDRVAAASQQLAAFLTSVAYTDFRDAERQRWDAYLLQQTRTSGERIRNLVWGSVFFKRKEDDYKDQIVAETKALSEKYSLEERKAWPEQRKHEAFEEIFLRVRQRASNECKMLHLSVEGNVARVYGLNHAMKRSIPMNARQAPRNQVHSSGGQGSVVEEPWYLRYPRQFFKQLFGGNERRAEEEAKNLNMLIVNLMTEIQNLLRDHAVYSDAAVEDAIRKTEEILVRNGEDRLQIKGEIHAMVREEVTTLLCSRQKEWDTRHSVPAQIDAAKNDLWLFFLGVINGLVVLEQLQNT